LTIWPPDVGETASCTAAPDAHAIVGPLTEAFFRKVAFTGIGGIEYKKDARTGAFLMIEPTVGRVDRQEEVATLHGVNIPLAAYCYELDLPMPSVDTRSKPIIWQDLLRHRKATWSAHPKQGARARYRIYDSYWRANDPIPALFQGLATSRRLLQKATNWARRRFVNHSRDTYTQGFSISELSAPDCVGCFRMIPKSPFLLKRLKSGQIGSASQTKD
jgi:D-aspartate ligase